MNLSYLRTLLGARRKTFYVLAGLLVVNLALSAYISYVQQPALIALQTEWNSRRRTMEGNIRQEEAAVYRQGKQDLQEWNARIPKKREFARCIGALLELAGNNSLTLGGIAYKPEQIKDENLLAYAISFTVTGKYGAIKSFLADVANLREIAVINAISLSNSSAIEEVVTLKLEVTAYFRMEG